MTRIRSNNTSIVVLGALALLASAPVYAQDEPDRDTDAGAESDAETSTDTSADTDADTEADTGTEADPEPLHPPHLINAPPPHYPPGRAAEGVHPTVILRITVTAEAQVTDIVIEHSAGDDFDQAAVEAVKRWTFEPARRGDAPVSSRIRVAVHFEPPSAGVPHEGERHEPQTTPHVPTTPMPENIPAEVGPAVEIAETKPEEPERSVYRTDAEVDAERLRAGGRGPVDFEIDREILDAVPVLGASDLLQRVPGLYVARPEGGAVGERIFLRGFDSEHGQDIEFKVGDIPLNQPSHIHGQGYTFLNLVIPETVRDLRVIEGVYDPRQGDFAIAGSIDYDLGVLDRGVYAQTQLGSFRTFRQVAIFAPEKAETDTFGAFQLRRTDGFGENRGGLDGSAMFQYGFGRNKWRFRLHGGFGGARYDLAGVVRRNDLQAGQIDWLGVYPFETARGQNGFNLAGLLGVSGAHRDEDLRNSSFGLWVQFHDFRLKQNFTGFLQTDETGNSPGDLLQQRDRRFVLGGNARHRTKQFVPADWAKGTVELGISGRVDIIGQELNLIEAPLNRIYQERVDADITQGDIGMWLDLDWDFTRFLNIKGGVRADVLFFDVNDRQESVLPEPSPPDSTAGYRRTAAGIAVGPRAAVTIQPIEELDLVLAYGRGFRSPQARSLIENEGVAFTRVHSADIGLRSRVGKNEELKLALTGFLAKLDNDLIFEAHEARFEELGPTTRIGATFYSQFRPAPWLFGALSVTYVRATLDETPEPEPGEPSAGLEAGDPVPFVPPWLLRLDLGVAGDLVTLGEHPLRGNLGLAYTFLGERPLQFSERSPRINLLDLSAGLSWWAFELGLQIYNLVNVQYAAQEFVFESNWNPEASPSDIPARHVAAGAPRTFLFLIGFRI